MSNIYIYILYDTLDADAYDSKCRMCSSKSSRGAGPGLCSKDYHTGLYYPYI